MTLQRLLITAIIGITALTSKAYANSKFVAYKPSILQTHQTPKKPKKENYFENMKAILQKDDKILEDTEIKYKQ